MYVAIWVWKWKSGAALQTTLTYVKRRYWPHNQSQPFYYSLFRANACLFHKSLGMNRNWDKEKKKKFTKHTYSFYQCNYVNRAVHNYCWNAQWNLNLDQFVVIFFFTFFFWFVCLFARTHSFQLAIGQRPVLQIRAFSLWLCIQGH